MDLQENINKRYHAISRRLTSGDDAIQELPFRIDALQRETAVFLFANNRAGILVQYEPNLYNLHIQLSNLISYVRPCDSLLATIVSGNKEHADFASRQMRANGIPVLGMHAHNYADISMSWRGWRPTIRFDHEKYLVVYPDTRQVYVKNGETGIIEEVGMHDMIPPRAKPLRQAA